jgi:GNAT superfamily N-acetyltransferase
VSGLRDRLDQVLVCTRADLSQLPPLPQLGLPDGVSIRDLDLDDVDDATTWLDVHNRSYGHAWRTDEMRSAMLDHRHIRVTRTFLLLDRDAPVAVASIGRFRRNEDVGVGHYLGVVPEAQGRRFGHVISAHRYRALRDEGVVHCESQTHIGRVRSLFIHFDCGFGPKWRLDPWNNPDTWSTTTRAVTNARLFALQARWRSRRLIEQRRSASH